MPRSFWGLLGGGGLGFALGGPLGALLGAAAGHFLVDQDGAPFGRAPREIVFTTGLVALSAKMARSDGFVHASEIATFRRIIDVPEAELPRIEALFDLAKATTDGFEAYASQIAAEFRDEPLLLSNVLDGLFHIAAADGAIHEAEHAYLRDVATIFGIGQRGFAAIEARHIRRRDDPYLALELNPDVDDATLKARYRELVRSLHPDREMARGLPQEAVTIATHRLAAINVAYARIMTERGLKPGLDDDGAPVEEPPDHAARAG
jgi:DnaJ like chaperone protein